MGIGGIFRKFFAIALFMATFCSLAVGVSKPATGDETHNFGTEVETRTYSIVRYLPAEYVDLDDVAVIAALPARFAFEEDGVSGALSLASISREPAYRLAEEQVERIAVFGGLAVPDVALLPLTCVFELCDGTSFGSTAPTELAYTAVSWSTDAYDAQGRPCSYTATVTYRGLERNLVQDYLKVEATYFGEVVREFELPAAEPETQQASETVVSAPVPLAAVQEGAVLLEAVAAGIAAIVLLGLALIVFIYRYHNVRVVHTDGSSRPHTILRRHVRLVDGIARLELPADAVLKIDESDCRILIKRELSRSEGELELVSGDRVLCRHPLQDEIALGDVMRSELVGSALRLVGAEAL